MQYRATTKESLFEGSATVSRVRDLAEARQFAASNGPQTGAYSIDFKAFEVSSEHRDCRRGGRIVFFLNELKAARVGNDTTDFDNLVDTIFKTVRSHNEVQAIIFAWKQPKVEVWLSTTDRRVTNRMLQSLNNVVATRGSFRPHAKYNQQVIRRQYGDHWDALKKHTRDVKAEQLNQLMADEHLGCLQDQVNDVQKGMRPRAQTTGSNPHQYAGAVQDFRQAQKIAQSPRSVTVAQLCKPQGFAIPIERELTRDECLTSATERAMPGGRPDEEVLDQAIQDSEQEVVDRRQFVSEIKSESKLLTKVMTRLRKLTTRPRGTTVSIPPTPQDLNQVAGDSKQAESQKCTLRHEVDEKRMLQLYKHGRH